MEANEPLALASAEAFWDAISPKLYARTIYQIAHMPWLSEEARSGIIQDGAVIDNIVDRLKEQFFGATRRKKVWSEAVERWFARTHRRTTRKEANREARRYFPGIIRRRDGQADSFELPGRWDSPESSAEKREILERITQHWRRLPLTKARLFQDLVDGLTAEEISARDGIRSGTVRKRIHDLRRGLRELITDKENPCPPRSPSRISSREKTRHLTRRRKVAA